MNKKMTAEANSYIRIDWEVCDVNILYFVILDMNRKMMAEAISCVGL